MSARKTATCVRLDEKPCVVKYLEECDQFLIGTYQQITIEEAKPKLSIYLEEDEIPKRWESLNRRFGSLTIINNQSKPETNLKPYEIICSLPCVSGGGIFDVFIHHKVNDTYNIYVAHANGMLGVYNYARNEITLLNTFKIRDNAKMLTSVDYWTREIQQENFQDQTYRIVTGDSDGRVTVVDNKGLICAKSDVSPGDPIWQVKFIGAPSCYVIAASENSSWYIFKYNDRGEEHFLEQQYHMCKNYTAGVTSITILPGCQFDETLVLTGSYDETIRTYRIRLGEEKELGVCHILPDISIPGGGIWRIKHTKANMPISGEQEYNLYIAAMYAGSYSHKINYPGHESTQPTKLDFEIGPQFECKEASLHYGIDVSSNDEVCCIVDFNNSLCYFVEL